MSKQQITLVKYYSNQKFSNNNFNADAMKLFNSDAHSFSESVFSNFYNIDTWEFKGIDPHLQEDGNVRVLFNFYVTWREI